MPPGLRDAEEQRHPRMGIPTSCRAPALGKAAALTWYLLQQDKQHLCRTSKNTLACACSKSVTAEDRGCLGFTMLHLFSPPGWLLILQVTLHKSHHGLQDHLGQFLVLQHIKVDLFKVIFQLCPSITEHRAVSKAPYSNIPV